ncbi:STAS domain-containing protein [Anaerolineae bacterium CFX7]|nr:STAS domain-containing protein [Anaerolineae bacterium CFX7]
MDLKTDKRDDVAVLAVSGSLDALSAPELADTISSQLDAGSVKLVADLAQLDYTSSAGLRVLLNGVKAARQKGGDLRLAAVQPNVKKVLDLSGFMSIMKSFPDVAAAVASYA